MPEFDSVQEAREYAQDLLMRQKTRLDKHIRIERIARLEAWTLQEVARNKPEHQDMWPTVTLNEPKTLYNAIRRACGKYEIQHKVWLPSLPTDRELEEVNIHERLLIGAYSDIDLLRRRRSQGRLQTDAIWFAAHRGGAIARTLVLKNADFTPFRIELFDPVATLFEPGVTGPAFVAHFRMEPKSVLEEQYGDAGDADKDGNIPLCDIWWKGAYKGKKGVFNIIIDPGMVYKGPDERNDLIPVEDIEDWGPEPFEDIPIAIVKGGSPGEHKPNGDEIGDSRQEDAWESSFDANEMMYAWLNRIASLYGLIIRNGAIGPYSVDPKLYKQYGDTIAAQLKPFGIVPGEVMAVTPPALAQNAQEFFAFLQGAVQRGGVPYSSFGMVPFQLSGFGINQLQGGIEIAALPIAEVLEDMYWLMDDEILRQVRRLRGKITVRGTDNRGKSFIEDIKGAALDKSYVLKTKNKLALPQDELLRAQVAEILSRMGVSQLTLYDEYLEIQDPHGEYERKLKEDLDRDPVLKALKMAQVAARGEMPEVAKYILETYVRPAMGGTPAGPPVPGPEIQPPESRGQLEQHEQFQAPPQNLPAEVAQGAMGAVLGG